MVVSTLYMAMISHQTAVEKIAIDMSKRPVGFWWSGERRGSLQLISLEGCFFVQRIISSGHSRRHLLATKDLKAPKNGKDWETR